MFLRALPAFVLKRAMNLLVGLVIVVCLVVCELDSQSAVEDVWTRIVAMLFVSLSVPGLAVFQTLVLNKRMQLWDLPATEQEMTLKRLSACHSAVWLVASLMIVWAVEWPTVVRSNWGLDHWPLIDEVLILLPIVLSLVASWAIFYDVQRSPSGTGGCPCNNDSPPSRRILDPKRIAFVAIRFRVYFLMSLLPLTVLVLFRDVNAMNETSPIVTAAGYLATTVLVLVGFPFILGLLWNVQPIHDEQLTSDLKKFCKDNRLRLAGVRVWHTGDQISNALVAGIVPWFRRIILTDGMLNRFPQHELFAILRHEAGHIRLCHLPIRIGFVLLPLLVLAVAEQMGISVNHKLNSALSTIGITGQPDWLIISIFYAVFLIASLSWLSKKMEFEADLYAVSDPAECQDRKSNILNQRANELLDALLRFASHFPEQLDRSTLWHPSLRQRMQRIILVRDNPHSLKRMQYAWRNQQLYFFLVLLAVCLAAVII